jgi:hypothetical protein
VPERCAKTAEIAEWLTQRFAEGQRTASPLLLCGLRVRFAAISELPVVANTTPAVSREF